MAVPRASKASGSPTWRLVSGFVGASEKEKGPKVAMWSQTYCHGAVPTSHGKLSWKPRDKADGEVRQLSGEQAVLAIVFSTSLRKLNLIPLLREERGTFNQEGLWWVQQFDYFLNTRFKVVLAGSQPANNNVHTILTHKRFKHKLGLTGEGSEKTHTQPPDSFTPKPLSRGLMVQLGQADWLRVVQEARETAMAKPDQIQGSHQQSNNFLPVHGQ